MVLEVSSKEKIKSLKLEFPKTVILIKVGIFYHAYNSDAGVLSYIMNYKFIKDSCGFAQNSLEKVITEFSKCKVNVYVDDMFFNFGDSYDKYLDLFKQKVNSYKLIEDIYNDVKNIISKDKESYYFIKEFLKEFYE